MSQFEYSSKTTMSVSDGILPWISDTIQQPWQSSLVITLSTYKLKSLDVYEIVDKLSHEVNL